MRLHERMNEGHGGRSPPSEPELAGDSQVPLDQRYVWRVAFSDEMGLY